jgi:hypothetical protein
MRPRGSTGDKPMRERELLVLISRPVLFVGEAVPNIVIVT